MKKINLIAFLAFAITTCVSAQMQTSPVRYATSLANKPLNILLITADDLDRNSLGCYGSKVPDISPHIDRFAAQSIRFEKSFVNAAICVPSRAILATGLYGHNSGVNGFKKMKEGTTIPLIMEILRSHNYAIGVLGKTDHSTPKKDFKWDYILGQANFGIRSPTLYYEKMKEFLADCNKNNKPFYLMVNSHDPHKPFYNPKETTEDLAKKMDIPLARMQEVMKTMEVPSRIYSANEITVPGFLPDLPEVREELSYYFNSAKRLDDTFGKIMQALEESGFADNTMVIFMSDNGIAFPFAKSNAYYASNLSPFIIRWPGTIKEGSINRTDLVSAIDFMPTVLEALQITAPKTLEGNSFLPLLKAIKQRGRDKAYMQIDYRDVGGPTPMRSVITKQWAYIYNAWADGERVFSTSGETLAMKAMEEAAKNNPAIAERIKKFRFRMPEELYDIKKDPDCMNNLINTQGSKKQLAQLRKDLESWMIKTKDPLLKVYQNRSKPVVALKEFYKAYPEAELYDKDKKNYSKNKGGKLER